jgi:[acyl-carrier-protein] S-malonyltransferase
MQQAGVEKPGTMAAVIGLLPSDVEEVCREAAEFGIVQAANFNSPGQVVISGSVEGVRKGMELAKARGAKLVKELPVSGAFHSPLMASAGDGLQAALKETKINEPVIPVYTNVTARPVRQPEEIKEMLYLQLTKPVRWEESIVNMAADGASLFVEIGPGKVLQGLIKRIAGSVKTRSIEKYNDLVEVQAQGVT